MCSYAASVGAKHYYTSAKQNRGVSELFLDLAKSETHIAFLTFTISSIPYTIVHSRSVDPRKLCLGIKYYIVHMYSMPYYTTANCLLLERTALIYMYSETSLK